MHSAFSTLVPTLCPHKRAGVVDVFVDKRERVFALDVMPFYPDTTDTLLFDVDELIPRGASTATTGGAADTPWCPHAPSMHASSLANSTGAPTSTAATSSSTSSADCPTVSAVAHHDGGDVDAAGVPPVPDHERLASFRSRSSSTSSSSSFSEVPIRVVEEGGIRIAPTAYNAFPDDLLQLCGERQASINQVLDALAAEHAPTSICAGAGGSSGDTANKSAHA